MPQRIIIRHMSGSKINQVEEFPVQHVREIVCGREPGVTIYYDPDRDDLVSRQHCRITQDPSNPDFYNITDLTSRNGTFLNQRRIFGTSRLSHGDVVQLGPGGPEFRFDLDPPPAAAAIPHPTRLAMDPSAASGRPAPPTRDASSPGYGMGMTPPGMPPTTSAGDGRPRPVGRATVERMLGDVVRHMKGDSNRAMTVGIVSLAAILVLGAGIYWYMRVVSAQTAQIDASAKTTAQAVEGLREDQRNRPDNTDATKQAVDDAARKAAELAAEKNKSLWAKYVADPIRHVISTKPAPVAEAAPPAPTMPPAPTPPAPVAPVVDTAGSDSGGSAAMPKILTADEVHEKNIDSVVYIESSWKLIDTNSGRQVYQVYLPNDFTIVVKKGFFSSTTEVVKRVPASNAKYVPVYMRDGEYLKPALTNTDDGGRNKPIGGQHVGSGFVVSEDGLILTSRDIVSAWDSAYVWAPDDAPGMVVNPDGSFAGTVDTTPELPRNWIPAGETASFWESASYDEKAKRFLMAPNRSRPLEGRSDYLNVIFAKTRQRTRAQLVRTSDRHDAALIKVSVGKLAAVELKDNYETIRVGEQVTVLGYLTVGPDTFAGTASKDTSGKVVPDPTNSIGNIAKIYRDAGPIEGVDYLPGEFGDSYRLGVNMNGHGFTGAPVFDGYGKVVALFYAGRSRTPTVSFAVPIKYGKELLTNMKVMP